LLQLHLRVRVPSPVAGNLARLVLVVQEPEGTLRLEAALDEPVDELLRLVGPPGGGDAEAECRVGGDEVDRMLFAVGNQRLARFRVGES
jgi:hypothetical protein